ncbi:MAG TPA: hypothetical protein VMT85_10065 [Thermoanaerobaculia bacterium]|nr:hypothetical protein [Thermoanaerobaculia bacterium]
MSLARIDDQRVLPYHVIDLVLGPATAGAESADSERLQTVRVLAPPWEGDFLGGKDLKGQCQLLVRGIREGAGCVSLTAETMTPTFRSIAEHDTALASAWRRRGQKPRTYLAKPPSRSSTVVP